MFRFLLSAVLFTFIATALAEEPTKPAPKDAKASLNPVLEATNKVPGLELPADQEVPYYKGFVLVDAKCAGEVVFRVRWVLPPDKQLDGPTGEAVQFANSIIVSILPFPGARVEIEAIGVVNGKSTPFAETVITVVNSTNPPDKPPTTSPTTPPDKPPTTPPTTPPDKPPDKPPTPPPGDNPPVTDAKLFVIMVGNLNQLTQSQVSLLGSAQLRRDLAARGHHLFIYDARAAILNPENLNLNTYVQKAGGPPAMLIQFASGPNKGNVPTSIKLPATEKEVLGVIDSVK